MFTIFKNSGTKKSYTNTYFSWSGVAIRNGTFSKIKYINIPEEGYPHVYLAGKQLPNEGEEVGFENGNAKKGDTKM